MTNKTCALCSAPIRVRADNLKERNFCSYKCSTRWWADHPSDAMKNRGMKRRVRITVACAGCATPLELPRWRVEREGKNYCGQSCMMRSKLLGRFGPDHPGWKGGVARYPKSFRTMRLLAMERDGFACQWAGPHDGALRLEVHHLNGQRHDNRLENLVTLCSVCHQGYHRKHPATEQQPATEFLPAVLV